MTNFNLTSNPETPNPKTPIEVINLFPKMPLKTKQRFGVSPDSKDECRKDECRVLNHYIEFYQNIKRRFRIFKTGEGLGLLKQRDIIVVKPYTDLAEARLAFCENIIPKLPRFANLQVTAAELWHDVEQSDLNNTLVNILGLFTHSPLLNENGRTYGKREFITEQRKHLKGLKQRLKDGNPIKAEESKPLNPEFQVLGVLKSEAINWAIEEADKDLENDIHNLLKAEERFIQTVDKHAPKEYCIPWPENGVIAPTKKGKRRKKQK